MKHGEKQSSTALARVKRAVVSVDRGIAACEEWLGMILLAMLFVLLISQVLFRFLINVSVFWIEEVARLGLIWIVLIGIGFAVARSAHIVVTSITDRLPARWIAWMDRISFLLMIVVGVMLAIASAELIQALGGVKASSSGLSRALFFLPGLIGFSLVAFHSLVRLIDGGPAPAHELSQIEESAV